MREILYQGGDQTIVFVPPAPVSLATYQIEDLFESTDSDSRSIAVGDATVDGFASELASTAGPENDDTRALELADEGIEAGRFYAIGSDDEWETHRVSRVDGATAWVSSPLATQHAAGTLVRGVELRATFPGSAAASDTLYIDQRPIRVLWTYTIGGARITAQQQYRLTRTITDGDHAELVQRMREEWPELVKEYSGDLGKLIAHAARDVARRMRKRQIEPTDIYDKEDAIIARAVWHLADQGIAPRSREAEQFAMDQKANFLNRIGSMLDGRPPAGTVAVDRRSDRASLHSKPNGGRILRRP